MKLSKAQLEYISIEKAKMDQRKKDLLSFGDDIYKSAELRSELGRIRYDLWFYSMMLNLHRVEVKAEKTAFDALKDELEKEMSE
jgi:hypothetical protein